MTDPSNALQSFQQFFLTGQIQLEPGRLDTNLYSYVDEMDGTTRFTFVRLESKTVTAFVVVARDGTIEGKPCFAIGYAVPEAYRNQGRAKEVVRAALAEMQGAFRRLYPEFYVLAIVGADNKFSQRVAEQTISNAPVTMTDKISGLPALKYLRKIKTSTAS
jgi:RimJ/RimL family protein N-acetyltransferase